MRWRGRRESGNIEDRRGVPVKGMAFGGVGGVVIMLLYLFLGGDPAVVLQQAQRQQARQPQANQEGQEELRDFTAVVLADTEDVWAELFRQSGQGAYRQPKLVLFSGRVESACGLASAASGPFYCPADQKVYIDLSFFDQMRTEMGAPGDFAMAYVIAHEIGHHVQNLTGILPRVHQMQQQSGEVEANRLSVRLELQADYLAGVWAHHAERSKQILEQGDIEEALRAASVIGDDYLQKRHTGEVHPDSFTHGTSAQRLRWLRRGLESGNFEAMQQLFEIPYEDL